MSSDADGRPRPRILVIEHEADSGPAMLAERAKALGFVLDVVTPESGIPRTSDGYVAVVSMGSAWGVHDDHAGDGWFADEQALLQDADAHGVPILGVCFGAQSLAHALGGAVTRAERPEIGWFTVDCTDEGLIEPGPWFQWHIDAISPPTGATVLARTEVCVQAYAIGPHLAVQFHPEVTEMEVSAWSADGAEILAGLGLRPDQLVAETRMRTGDARLRAYELFDRFLVRAAIALPVG